MKPIIYLFTIYLINVFIYFNLCCIYLLILIFMNIIYLFWHSLQIFSKGALILFDSYRLPLANTKSEYINILGLN